MKKADKPINIGPMMTKKELSNRRIVSFIFMIVAVAGLAFTVYAEKTKADFAGVEDLETALNDGAGAQVGDTIDIQVVSIEDSMLVGKMLWLSPRVFVYSTSRKLDQLEGDRVQGHLVDAKLIAGIWWVQID